MNLRRIITSTGSKLFKPKKSAGSPAGDTLIEVMFAFVILGSIISFAYTGVIQARRSAIDAQQRTQATFLAQYQKNALNAYRSGLPWDVSGGSPSFLEGGNPGITTTSPVNDSALGSCLSLDTANNINNWVLKNETDPATNCTIPAASLYGGSGKVKITFAPYNTQGQAATSCTVSGKNCSALLATITVSWKSTSGIENSVTNTVVLTK